MQDPDTVYIRLASSPPLSVATGGVIWSIVIQRHQSHARSRHCLYQVSIIPTPIRPYWRSHLPAVLFPVHFLLQALAKTFHHVESHEVLAGDDTHHLVLVVHHRQVSQTQRAKNHVRTLERKAFRNAERRFVDVVGLKYKPINEQMKLYVITMEKTNRGKKLMHVQFS